jgi:hypothetical protein
MNADSQIFQGLFGSSPALEFLGALGGLGGSISVLVSLGVSAVRNIAFASLPISAVQF